MSKLRDEIIGDPEGIGYAGKTEQQVISLLSAVNRTRGRDSVPAYEVFDSIAPADLAGLDVGGRARLQFVLSLGQINIMGVNTRNILLALFTDINGTRGRIIALRTETVSRVAELGLGRVRVGDIIRARS